MYSLNKFKLWQTYTFVVNRATKLQINVLTYTEKVQQWNENPVNETD